MISAYCQCCTLELGWFGSLGHILSQLTESSTQEPWQKFLRNTWKILDTDVPSSPHLPPGDGGTSVGGRKGTEEAGEQNGIERLQAFFFFFSPLDFLLLSIPFASYSPYWRTLTPWCLRSAKRAPDSRLLARLPLCSPFALLHLGGAVFIDSEWQRDVGWVERSKKLKAACAQESPNICHLIRVQEGTCAKVMTFLCLLLHNGEHKGENWPSSSICLCLFNLYCWQYYIGPSFPPN